MMFIAHRLLDHFVNSLNQEERDEIYLLANEDMELATARLAILYEDLYKDYPTGYLADLLINHLKDKSFQLQQAHCIA